VAAPKDVRSIAAVLQREGESVVELGQVTAAASGPQVSYTGSLDLSR